MTRDGSLAGKRILVLEDDFYLADDEKALLEEAGAEVVGPFGSRTSMTELDKALPVDGALVDINLGNGPSFAFAHSLRERGIPFVFVTGYDAAVIPAELADMPRIEKPVRPRSLVAALVEQVEPKG